MTTPNEFLTVTLHGTTVEELVWKRVRRRSPDLVREVLDINPGLSALGHHLPLGTKVKMPVYEQQTKRRTVQPVRLWD